MSCVTGTYARGHISQPHRQRNLLMSGDGLPRLHLLWLSDRRENIEHQSSCMSRKMNPVLRRRCAQLQDQTHITEICAGNTRAHTGGGGGGGEKKHKLRSQQTQKLHACSKHIMQKGTWRHLHFPSPAACFLYLLGGERLRPVVQDEPVFVEGFGLRRRFLALLAVCDLAVLVHRWDGPPATVGGGNMVGRRHDRAFCVRV